MWTWIKPLTISVAALLLLGCATSPSSLEQNINEEMDASIMSPKVVSLKLQHELNENRVHVEYDSPNLQLLLPSYYLFNRKNAIRKNFKPYLNAIVDTIKDQQLFNVQILAYTGSAGDWLSNKKLTTAWANTVKSYLVSQGIDAKHITARGKGEMFSIGNEYTARGRLLNRRVEIILGRSKKANRVNNANQGKTR